MLADREVRQEVVRGSLEDVAHHVAAEAAEPARRCLPTFRSPTQTSPDVARSMPVSTRRSEDFPLPDGPTTAVSAPAGS